MLTFTSARANMSTMMGISAELLAGMSMKATIRTMVAMKPKKMNFRRPILSQMAPAMGAPTRRVP